MPLVSGSRCAFFGDCVGSKAPMCLLNNILYTCVCVFS